MTIPGEPIEISYVNQKGQQYLLANRSNKSLDIFSASTDKYIRRVAGFVGLVKKGDKAVNGESGRMAGWWRATRLGWATAIAPSRSSISRLRGHGHDLNRR